MLSSIVRAKLDESATLKECLSHKERCYCFVHSLDPDFDTFTSDATDCLVRDLKSSPITCYFLFLSPSFVLSHALYSAIIFGAFINAARLSSSFFMITVYGSMPALRWPTKDKNTLKYLLLLLKCFIHSSFCHKITDSILGSAFLSISMVCNSKILSNIMQIKVVYIYAGCSEFACGKIKNWPENWAFRSRSGTRPIKYSTVHTIHSTTDYFLNLEPREFTRALAPPRASGFWAPRA